MPSQIVMISWQIEVANATRRDGQSEQHEPELAELASASALDTA
jgi:hypothetical protein